MNKQSTFNYDILAVISYYNILCYITSCYIKAAKMAANTPGMPFYVCSLSSRVVNYKGA